MGYGCLILCQRVLKRKRVVSKRVYVCRHVYIARACAYVNMYVQRAHAFVWFVRESVCVCVPVDTSPQVHLDCADFNTHVYIVHGYRVTCTALAHPVRCFGSLMGVAARAPASCPYQRKIHHTVVFSRHLFVEVGELAQSTWTQLSAIRWWTSSAWI